MWDGWEAVGGKMTEEYNLPVPDDAPWLNLSSEEIEELRNNKKQLSEYGREKIRALAKEGILKYDEALRKLAE
jgi:hypothetical protein